MKPTKNSMNSAKVNIPQSSLSANDISAPPRFSKAYNDLIELGLPLRLVVLYGRLEFHAGKNGHCHPRHSTLAKELGLRRRQTIPPLLAELRDLHLIEWIRRGPHANQYRILAPDINLVKDVRKSGHLDVRKSGHRKESSSGKRETKSASLAKAPIPAPEKPKNFEKPDDEQKPLVPRAGSASLNQNPPEVSLPPEAEFRRRLAARGHGPLFDADRAVACVLRQLGKLGIDIGEFLAFDATHTTGHGKSFSNPIGYYVSLAKDYVKTTRDQTLKVMVAAAAAGAKPPPDIPRNGHGRCVTC